MEMQGRCDSLFTQKKRISSVFFFLKSGQKGEAGKRIFLEEEVQGLFLISCVNSIVCEVTKLIPNNFQHLNLCPDLLVKSC